MMNPKTAVSILAAVCVALAPAGAQESTPEWPVHFGFLVGGESINGGLHSEGRLGLELGILAEYQLPARHFALRSDVLLHAFGTFICVPNFGVGCSASGSLPRDMISWSFDGIARLNDLNARWSPYLLAGGALYATSGSNGETVPAHVGLQWGAGMEFRTGKTARILFEWRQLGMSPGSIGPITFGMRF